jgi:hypothetical protein
MSSFFNEYCEKTSTVYSNQPWTKETISRKRGALKRLDWMYKYGTIVKCGQKMLPPLPPYFADIMREFNKWQVKKNYAANTVIAHNRFHLL